MALVYLKHTLVHHGKYGFSSTPAEQVIELDEAQAAEALALGAAVEPTEDQMDLYRMAHPEALAPVVTVDSIVPPVQRASKKLKAPVEAPTKVVDAEVAKVAAEATVVGEGTATDPFSESN